MCELSAGGRLGNGISGRYPRSEMFAFLQYMGMGISCRVISVGP